MASHEYQITIFSPEGKLHQVEYAFKAIKSCNLTSLAIRGKDSVVVAIQKKVDDRLIDPSSVTNILRITPQIGVMITGRESDGRSWVTRLKQEAFEYLQENGNQIPVDVMTVRAANIAQLYTQKSSMRAYACELVFFGYDVMKGSMLYKVDPSGHFLGYYACSSGVKEQEGNNVLEKVFKEKKGFEGLSSEENVRLAIESLQNTLGQDFKKNDVEVAMVNKETGEFKRLTEEEIEAHLQIIQKFD